MNDAAIPHDAPRLVSGLLNGAEAAGGDVLTLVNPATAEPVTELREQDADAVDAAARAARQAFRDGGWSRRPLLERAAVLQRAAALLREEGPRLAALDTLTTGLVHHAATAPQAQAAAGWLDYFAATLLTLGDDLHRQIPHAQTIITREPAGVAALFTPWNIPLMGATLKLGAALAMGNSVIIKPSEQSPLGSHRLVAILHEAGVPENVLQLVNGRGAVTGAALAAHPEVDLVSFTGGENAGRAIYLAAAERFARATMELGGKSANIIFDDADYERALDGSLTAIYANNGEACLAGSRILVQRTIAERFIADFAARTDAIRVGDPFDRTTEIGPLASAAHLERVRSFLDTDAGGSDTVVTGGERCAELGAGYYLRPALLRSERNDSPLCQQEIFGPVGTVIVFDTEEEAVAIANDTRFGLAGYVWSENLGRALRVADALDTGYVLVNSPMTRERNAPFGGFGHSGIDREGGRWSLDFYSEAKATVVPFRDFPMPTMGRGTGG